jgi:hypothetical protein
LKYCPNIKKLESLNTKVESVAPIINIESDQPKWMPKTISPVEESFGNIPPPTP